MYRLAPNAKSPSLIAGVVAAAVLMGPAMAAESAPVPNFAPDSRIGWIAGDPNGENPVGQDFLQPPSGPGPVTFDKAHRYYDTAAAKRAGVTPTLRVADLSNPILQPWVIERMRKENAAVIAGKIGFTARSRCWPHGVPGFLLYPVHPIIFIQTAKEVLMTWGQDFQLRHVYLNVKHSEYPNPSWYGESVGHYENGDTLVVDTIGLNDRTYVDNYRTPHTTQLHVVERFRIIDNGAALDVRVRVEDRGAFTMPWNAVQHYRVDHRPGEVPLHEMMCAENNSDHFHQGLVPIPQSAQPDF